MVALVARVVLVAAGLGIDRLQGKGEGFQIVALQVVEQFLQIPRRGIEGLAGLAVRDVYRGVEARRADLVLLVRDDAHLIAVDEGRRHVAVMGPVMGTVMGIIVRLDLDEGDAAADGDRGRGRLEGDVLLVAHLAADVAQQARGDVRHHVARLFLGIVDELVDHELRVGGDRERRLVGEEDLRLAGVLRRDALVAHDVVADEEGALRLVGRLADGVGIDRGGDADRRLIRRRR